MINFKKQTLMIKKITPLSFLFLFAALINVSAQPMDHTRQSSMPPGSGPIFPYYQNFDSLIAGQTIEEQGGWNVDFIPFGYVNDIIVTAQRGLNGSNSLTMNMTDTSFTDSTTSPLIGPMTANTTFGFSYRIVNANGQPHSLNGNGGFKVIFKDENSFNWQLVDSISASNHVDSSDYQRVEVPIGAFNGMNGNFRIAFYQGFPGDDFFIDIDSLVIYDPTITNMGLTAENSNDYIISSNDLNQITVSNKGLIAPNNLINIFSVDGKLIYSSNIKNNNTMIDASQWNKGVYFVQINNSKNQFNKKIIVR
jgi:hypothetical protein